MVRTSVESRNGKPELSEKAQRLLAAHDREVHAHRDMTKR